MASQSRRVVVTEVAIVLSCIILLTSSSPLGAASRLLPHVSPDMEKPEFWIKKIENPGRLLWTPEEIQRLNEQNLERQDLYLFNVKSLKEEWSKEEIQSLLNEDWQGFGEIEEGRFDRSGTPLRKPFWAELRRNSNEESLGEKNRLRLGLIVKRTDIRFFPTRALCSGSSTSAAFDQFQHSTVSPGSLVGVYHFSKDRLWAYVQTEFVRGWVQAKDLAIAKDPKEASDYDETKDRLMMTGDSINVFRDPSLRQTALTAQMGSSFPLFNLPRQNRGSGPYDLIKVPFREADGQLIFRKGYIPKGSDVHSGFLPYTQKNLGRQVFKMLHQPYGWGEMMNARDCSRLIMDLFSTFGIRMPRNSKFQARMGTDLAQAEGKTLGEKKILLDHAIPIVTLLHLPGHIMLYLGKDHGRYYAIHNLWGIQKAGESGPLLQKIGRVVVSDLSLGESGPNGSLLDRITDIRVMAPLP